MRTSQRRELEAALPFLTRALIIGIGLWVAASAILAIPHGPGHSVESMTPFADVGMSNTVSDTSFFVRPFSSLGLVSHFDGGATFKIAPVVSVGALAYGVQASGQQRIFSKVKNSGSSAKPDRRSPTLERCEALEPFSLEGTSAVRFSTTASANLMRSQTDGSAKAI